MDKSVNLPEEAEEQPQPGSSSNEATPVKILLETREKRGLPHRSKSECSCQQRWKSVSETSSTATSPRQSYSGHSISSHVFHSSLSCASSINSIGSVLLSGSQSSGFSTESSYQTAIARESNMSFSNYADSYRRVMHTTSSDNCLREIHVSHDSIPSVDQIEAINLELRSLLTNEIQVIHELSGGTRQAVYVIAYSLM